MAFDSSAMQKGQPAGDDAALKASLRSQNLVVYLVISSLALALAFATAQECSSVFHLPSLLYGLVLWCWWGVVGCAQWWTGRRSHAGVSFSAKSLAIQIPLGALIAWAHLVVLWSLGFTGLGWYSGSSAQTAWHALVNINRYGLEILNYGFIFGIIGVVQYQIRGQREMLRSVELQRQLSAAQLRALQMQLEPHFLFNTLNAITTLIELGRYQQASNMLSHLNAILKSTLKRGGPEKVPLSQELEMVENYLAIEQVRFADRLRIQIKVEPGALDSLVPCFLLQPIVENAIRHGVGHCEGEGILQAWARREGDLLRLEVCDTGSGHAGPSMPGNGIGLKNTRERLSLLYEDSYEMMARPLASGGFIVSIKIPYEQSRCD